MEENRTHNSLGSWTYGQNMFSWISHVFSLENVQVRDFQKEKRPLEPKGGLLGKRGKGREGKEEAGGEKSKVQRLFLLYLWAK